jgi:cytochrome c oxidase accessory protein FixG
MNSQTKPDGTSATAGEPISFYAKADKIHPREVSGRFARLRVLAVLVLLGLYYLVPWISWGGRQAVLFDLPARKFYIFGLTLWPQDFFYLAILLIIAALSLFFFTALAGRLWCGFACPQTVWTEVFIWIERMVEGRRNQRIKLDKSAWSRRKLRLKILKHGIWIAFALYTGFTFVGYFTPIKELGAELARFSLGPWETFWVLFYGFATYGNAGWMREQVCIYMCPYARFQSAMFDKDTLIISYDSARGEPRGSRRKDADLKASGLGDCVDCKACVQACPTGIDIRNGLQYQCIGCAACIDVCDEIMDKMGYQRGLVRYTTENALEHQQTHVLRPRMFVYAGILLLLVSGLSYAVLNRTPLELGVIRDRNSLYRETGNGLIENVYTLKLLNMDEADHRYTISASGLPEMELVMDAEEISVPSGAILNVPVSVRIDPEDLRTSSSEIEFQLQSVDQPNLNTRSKARFIGPAPR